MGVQKPPRLRPGDTVGLVAPASPWENRSEMLRAIAALEAWDLRVRLGAHVDDRHGYLAGRDVDRAADVNAMFADPDVRAVYVSTLHPGHKEWALKTIAAGKALLCEKPLTLTIDEGKRLVEVERQTGRILQTGTQQRSDQRFRMAVDLVRNGRIGKLEKVEVWLPAGLRQARCSHVAGAIPGCWPSSWWQPARSACRCSCLVWQRPRASPRWSCGCWRRARALRW